LNCIKKTPFFCKKITFKGSVESKKQKKLKPIAKKTVFCCFFGLLSFFKVIFTGLCNLFELFFEEKEKK